MVEVRVGDQPVPGGDRLAPAGAGDGVDSGRRADRPPCRLHREPPEPDSVRRGTQHPAVADRADPAQADDGEPDARGERQLRVRPRPTGHHRVGAGDRLAWRVERLPGPAVAEWWHDDGHAQRERVRGDAGPSRRAAQQGHGPPCERLRLDPSPRLACRQPLRELPPDQVPPRRPGHRQHDDERDDRPQRREMRRAAAHHRCPHTRGIGTGGGPLQRVTPVTPRRGSRRPGRVPGSCLPPCPWRGPAPSPRRWGTAS